MFSQNLFLIACYFLNLNPYYQEMPWFNSSTGKENLLEILADLKYKIFSQSFSVSEPPSPFSLCPGLSPGLTPRVPPVPGIVPWLGWAWEQRYKHLVRETWLIKNPSIIIKINIKQFILSHMETLVKFVFVCHYAAGKHVHCVHDCNWYQISVRVDSSWLMFTEHILLLSTFPHSSCLVSTLFMQLCPLPVYW